MSSSNPNNQHSSTSLNDHSSQSNTNAHIDPNNGYTASDNQLAGLVEAATAAADQDQDLSHWAAAAAATAASHQQLEGYGSDMHLGEEGFGDANFGSGMGGNNRHLRVPNDHSHSPGLSRTVSKKRKRNDDNLDPALTAAGLSGSQQQHSSQQNSHGFSGDNMDIRSVPPQSLSEARAVGVHSAAALFRQPSSNKKYTRPPMSKLFSSLELSPENFLHLQAAATAFMLDDAHPERRDCVGQRGKGDTEMVKLRLWNCVRHFLEAEGHGERFFGEDVLNEGMTARTYIWPRDQQKIISLVIPLLRRMVTNERQRQYAIETRKGGGNDDRRRRQTNEGFPDMNGQRFSPEHQLQMHGQDHRSQDVNSTMQQQVQNHSAPMDPNQVMDLGLSDLLLDGYTLDWNEFAKTYDVFNQGYELDNLWSLSGLQQPEWRGLVAAVDSHYRVVHNGEYDCPGPCEDANVNRIIHANSTASLPWRIGGERNIPARDEFASSITRDISRIIRENMAGNHIPAPDHQFTQQPFVPIPTSTNPSNSNSTNQAVVRIHVLQQGKRILPRVDLPTAECPSADGIKQAIIRRHASQIPGFSFLQDTDIVDPVTQQARDAAAATWKVRAWLPEGLLTVHSEKDWAIALLTADTVDWMDGELKVLVDIDAPTSQ